MKTINYPKELEKWFETANQIITERDTNPTLYTIEWTFDYQKYKTVGQTISTIYRAHIRIKKGDITVYENDHGLGRGDRPTPQHCYNAAKIMLAKYTLLSLFDGGIDKFVRMMQNSQRSNEQNETAKPTG